MNTGRDSILMSIICGPEQGRCLRTEKAAVSIGRALENDLALPFDPAVSARHARLIRKMSGWIIEDVNSRNGVFVDVAGEWRRLTDSTPIGRSGSFMVGTTVIKFMETGGEPSRAVTIEFDDSIDAESAVLHIDIAGDELKYRLLYPTAPQEQYTVPYRPRDIQSVKARLERTVLLANRRCDNPVQQMQLGDDVVGMLMETGALLRDTLLPAGIQRRLSESGGSDLFIVHDRHLLNVPWELIAIDNQFLCCKFNIGRRIMAENMAAASAPAELDPDRQTRMLIIANPTGDLPRAQIEAETIFNLVGRTCPDLDLDFVGGSRVRRVDLLSRLNSSDIVYYVGHAEYDESKPSNSAWLLDGDRVTCSDFRGLSSPPKLVLANGCETGKDADWSSEYAVQGTAYGLASGFVLSGVRHYIGSIWPISAAGSIDFARNFFDNLVRGISVGQSVRESRKQVIDRHGLDEIVWASYVLYGDPASRLF